jgi:hypothetical protein
MTTRYPRTGAGDHSIRSRPPPAARRWSGVIDQGSRMGAGIYTLKLELPDGRWSVDEKHLDARPRVGQLLELGTWWMVRSVERVPVRAVSKPDRELFVCTPL